MSVLADTLHLPEDLRLTDVMNDRIIESTIDEVASGHLIVLPADQHASVELSFLDAHMPFSIGGLAGMLPDGRPWVFIAQRAPLEASADVGQDHPWWVLRDSVHRALRFNFGAYQVTETTYTRESLLDLYRGAGVPRRQVMTWSVADLLRGLMAEFCGAPLWVCVVGHDAGCALQGLEHECAGDVYTDVFTAWSQQRLPVATSLRPEPDLRRGSIPRPADLRRLRRKKLRRLARSYRVEKTKKLGRLDLMRAIRKAAMWEARAGVRRPTGEEEQIVFRQFETFLGVDQDWLLPRLLLDPASSPVNYTGDTVVITVEEESVVLTVEDVCGVADPVAHLANADLLEADVCGFADVVGPWVRSYIHENKDTLVWVGEQDDLRELTLDWLGDFVLDTSPGPDGVLEIATDHLHEADADDRASVLRIVGGAIAVALNGTLLDSAT